MSELGLTIFKPWCAFQETGKSFFSRRQFWSLPHTPPHVQHAINAHTQNLAGQLFLPDFLRLSISRRSAPCVSGEGSRSSPHGCCHGHGCKVWLTLIHIVNWDHVGFHLTIEHHWPLCLCAASCCEAGQNTYLLYVLTCPHMSHAPNIYSYTMVHPYYVQYLRSLQGARVARWTDRAVWGSQGRNGLSHPNGQSNCWLHSTFLYELQGTIKSDSNMGKWVRYGQIRIVQVSRSGVWVNLLCFFIGIVSIAMILGLLK